MAGGVVDEQFEQATSRPGAGQDKQLAREIQDSVPGVTAGKPADRRGQCRRVPVQKISVRGHRHPCCCPHEPVPVAACEVVSLAVRCRWYNRLLRGYFFFNPGRSGQGWRNGGRPPGHFPLAG